MAKWPLVGGSPSTAITDGTSVYLGFGGNLLDATEANIQQEARDSYTVSNLRVYCSAFSGGNVVVTFRVNGTAAGSPSNLAQTVNATGEFEDTTNTASVSAGDLMSLIADASAQGHGDSATLSSWQVTIDASSDVPLLLSGVVGGVPYFSIPGGATRYQVLIGGVRRGNGDSTQGAAAQEILTAQTFRDFRIYKQAHKNNVTFTVMKFVSSWATTSITVTATGTGEFTDFTNTAAFSANDLVELRGVAAGSMFTDEFSVWAIESNVSSAIVSLDDSLGSAQAFLSPSGAQSTTEAHVEVEAAATATIDNLTAHCYTYAETRTYRTRKNQANGGLSVSVTGTGYFRDTSGSDSLAATDDWCFQQAAGSSGTNAFILGVDWDGAATYFGPDVAAFRFYEDGTESGSTPIDDQDTDINRNVDANSQVHLRLRVDEVGGLSGAATDDYQLQYNKNSTGWNDVTAASSNVQADTGSALTDGAATTNRATNGLSDPATGSFVAGEQEEANGDIEDVQLTVGDFTEHVYALLLIAADLSNSDTLDFRLQLTGTGTLTNTVVPTITAVKTTATHPQRLTLMGVS